MPIHLKEINAEGLGQLGKFSKELKLVNLIYGKNERGKTFLVEFIIRSLFNYKRKFNLRNNNPKGKITISGLGDEDHTFSEKSKPKFEDVLFESEDTMPVDFSKLMVIKGGEAALDQSVSGGVNKQAIKGYLSNNNLLEKLTKKVTKTFLAASIVGGQVSGLKNAKLGRDRTKFEERDEELKALFEDITNTISWGTYSKLKNDEVSLKNQKEQQLLAKRYMAYKVANGVDNLQDELDTFERNNFSELKSNIDAYPRAERSRAKAEESLLAAKNDSKNYRWLKLAQLNYEKLIKTVSGNKISISVFDKIVFILGGALMVFTLIASIMEMPSIWITSSAMLVLLAIIYSGIKFFKGVTASNLINLDMADSIELKRLEDEFLQKMKVKLLSKTTIEEMINLEEKSFHQIPVFEKELNDATEELNDLINKISTALKLFEQDNDVENWAMSISKIEKKKKTLENDFREKDNFLHKLNVQKDDYLENHDGEDYSESRLNQIQESLEGIKDALKNEDSFLNELKIRAITTLSLSKDTYWEVILDNLQSEIEANRDQLENVQSEIIARFILGRSIEKIKSKEDENIVLALNSDNVTAPIKLITGKYDSLTLEGNEIILHSDLDEWALGDLSTGTQEQVLLGIRIGLISKFFGKNQGFLILDDAFLHSDYERRERIVKLMFELANNGWQIFYFSMDDHIASLFDKHGKKIKKEYQRINI